MESKKEKWLRVGIMFGSVMLSVIVTIVSAIKLGSASTSGTSGTISLDSINTGISLLLGLSTFIVTELIS